MAPTAKRDAASIKELLRTTLLTAYSGALGRAPIVAQLIHDAQDMLGDYVHALNQEKTADTLRLDFLLSQSRGFDLIVDDKTYGISTRAEIDEAMAETVARTGDEQIDALLTSARALEPWDKRTTDGQR